MIHALYAMMHSLLLEASVVSKSGLSSGVC
jgi:hypothetical protein